MASAIKHGTPSALGRALSRRVRDRRVHLWRNFSTSGVRGNEHEVYVPFGFDGRYAVFSFRDYLSSGVTNLGRVKEGIVGAHQMHTAATKSGTWTTSASTEAFGGNAAWSATAGETIVFTVTGHTIVWRGFVGTNGGLGLVAVDGDYTKANRLPAVTQTEVDAGWFAAGDIGKRYINCYTNIAQMWDEHIPLAEGLTNEAHTVTLQATGTKLAASSAARLYVSAIAGATGTAKPGDTGTAMYYTRKVSDQGIAAGFSALGVAPEYTPDGFVNYQFIGENHGSESQTSAAWTLDGAAITPTADQYLSGDALTLARVTTLVHPSTGATVVATKDATYSFSATRDYPARLEYDLTWSNAGGVRAGYHGMLHVGARNFAAEGRSNFDFPMARVGTTAVGPLTANDELPKGAAQSNAITFYSTAHALVATVQIDAVINVNGWAKSAPLYAFVQDRADGEDKAYFARSSSTNIEAVAVNDVHSGIVEWRLARTP